MSYDEMIPYMGEYGDENVCSRCGQQKEAEDMADTFERLCQSCADKSYDTWITTRGALQAFATEEDYEDTTS